jgi:preprotein translocase subunit YajC
MCQCQIESKEKFNILLSDFFLLLLFFCVIVLDMIKTQKKEEKAVT